MTRALRTLDAWDRRGTPGPWRVSGSAVVADTPVADGPLGADDVAGYGGHLIAESITQANAELIVEARNALPDLLRTIAEQHRRINHLEALLADVRYAFTRHGRQRQGSGPKSRRAA